jgi:hypothetical protein
MQRCLRSRLAGEGDEHRIGAHPGHCGAGLFCPPANDKSFEHRILDALKPRVPKIEIPHKLSMVCNKVDDLRANSDYKVIIGYLDNVTDPDKSWPVIALPFRRKIGARDDC